MKRVLLFALLLVLVGVAGAAAEPLALTSLTSNVPSPQTLGTTVTFTASATGGTAPLQYKWWVFNGSVWSVGQDWSASNAFPWTPASVGAHSIGVWARSSGNTTDAPENNAVLATAFTINATAPLALTSLTSNVPSPQTLGTTVTFTASATGGTAPLQYKWWVFNGSVWSVGQDWSASNAFPWTPASVGAYSIGVWARSSGNTTDAPENNAVLATAFTIAVSLLGTWTGEGSAILPDGTALTGIPLVVEITSQSGSLFVGTYSATIPFVGTVSLVFTGAVTSDNAFAGIASVNGQGVVTLHGKLSGERLEAIGVDFSDGSTTIGVVTRQ